VPRKKIQKGSKHVITHDFILQLYSQSKKMSVSEKEIIVDKLKNLVNYIGDEIVVEDIHVKS